MQNKKYIIFDLDGTLVDSIKVLAGAINYVRDKLNLYPLEVDIIKRAINNPQIEPSQFFYETSYFTKEQKVWFEEYYCKSEYLNNSLFDGIEDLIVKLKSRYKLSIATNAYKNSAYHMVKSTNIENFFDIVMCADMVKNPKPNPQIIEKIMNYYNDANTKRYLFIGDSKIDIMTAKNAGIDYLIVNWGFEQDRNSIKNISELEKILL